MPHEAVTYIGIHPYESLEETYETDPEFVQIRNQILADRSLAQVLLVSEPDLDQTIIKFSLKIGPKLMVVETHYDRPTPRRIAFSSLSNTIMTEFPANSYVIWGAELRTVDGRPVGGCVDYAFKYLSLPNKRIDLDACWKIELNRREI